MFLGKSIGFRKIYFNIKPRFFLFFIFFDLLVGCQDKDTVPTASPDPPKSKVSKIGKSAHSNPSKRSLNKPLSPQKIRVEQEQATLKKLEEEIKVALRFSFNSTVSIALKLDAEKLSIQQIVSLKSRVNALTISEPLISKLTLELNQIAYFKFFLTLKKEFLDIQVPINFDDPKLPTEIDFSKFSAAILPELDQLAKAFPFAQKLARKLNQPCIEKLIENPSFKDHFASFKENLAVGKTLSPKLGNLALASVLKIESEISRGKSETFKVTYCRKSCILKKAPENELKNHLKARKLSPPVGPTVYLVLKKEDEYYLLLQELTGNTIRHDDVKTSCQVLLKLIQQLIQLEKASITYTDISPGNLSCSELIDFDNSRTVFYNRNGTRGSQLKKSVAVARSVLAERYFSEGKRPGSPFNKEDFINFYENKCKSSIDTLKTKLKAQITTSKEQLLIDFFCDLLASKPSLEEAEGKLKKLL